METGTVRNTPRRLATAAEVTERHAEIARRLEKLGLETRPEVAARVVALVSDPHAGMREFAGIIRADSTLTGRMLRLANSAYFAQRKPVTALDRACVLLGLERLKTVALGFYLSRAAASDPSRRLSRRVWSQSVFRACLAAECARETCPAHVPEAFVIGLMMDCGLPLVPKLLDGSDSAAYDESGSPGANYERELDAQPFTHVDVAQVLMGRWRIPGLLARPIEWHHVEPAGARRDEPLHALHRVAHYAGSIRLGEHGRALGAEPALARRVLGVDGDVLALAFERAGHEYRAQADLFSDVADAIAGIDALMEESRRQITELMDRVLAREFRAASQEHPEAFTVRGQTIVVHPGPDGNLAAFLVDSSGRRLLSHTFSPDSYRARDLADALGLGDAGDDDFRDIDAFVRSRAA